MQSPRKPTSKQLEGLEIARNPNWFQSVFLGFERAVFRAPTSFLTMFGMPLWMIVYSVCRITVCLALIVVGLPLWVLVHIGYLLIGVFGHLRRDTSARNHQSVVS